jgi:CO/xanthine dehydrogenase FAD-binding subunit
MTEYLRPHRLTDALAALAAGSRLVVAGGTDVMPALQGRALRGAVLDVTALPELTGIDRTGDGWRIGAATRWSALRDAALPPAFDALRAAAAEVGGRQIQNAGTLAGNLCNASPAADGVPPLLVLDAAVELASARGTRRLALAEFLTGARRTVCAPDEILTAVLVPEAAVQGRAAFRKLGARRHLVISIAMVAVRIEADAGMIRQAALAVGACSAVARRLPLIEAALAGLPAGGGAPAVEDAVVAAALDPIDDLRGSAAFRSAAAAELLRRALADLAGAP